MEIDYQHLMSQKSDEGLQVYIDNQQKYTPETLEAVIAELERRGKTFSTEEKNSIAETIANKRTVSADPEIKSWKKNIVKDISAPEYYPEWSLWLFSSLFSPVFAATLLAINLKNDPVTSRKFIIVGFGIVYTALAIILIMNLPPNTLLTISINGLGGLILQIFFWKKYIGADTKYRAKPIWIPLIISIIIILPIIFAAVYFS